MPTRCAASLMVEGVACFILPLHRPPANLVQEARQCAPTKGLSLIPELQSSLSPSSFDTKLIPTPIPLEDVSFTVHSQGHIDVSFICL
ncbi:unnamed protein product [Timema podura]|uniref:Uncharacterized protein n=1 Tax=Timema podura TaxID=61482 RepID=A0ABN7NNN0_TIMPD|nr:unnamed protein product [Timema podura]